eukprot:TRINITY_DN60054_c0_g1_i1.p2 TRINITY_DN60054_c0_g1~~TRINITY_DN60054_c0_g1_i1.p2  ORF type:complete len:134 (-),score=8.42 TRINITY_DN60054_c0_g1_i1:9-410(-)
MPVWVVIERSHTHLRPRFVVSNLNLADEYKNRQNAAICKVIMDDLNCLTERRHNPAQDNQTTSPLCSGKETWVLWHGWYEQYQPQYVVYGAFSSYAAANAAMAQSDKQLSLFRCTVDEVAAPVDMSISHTSPY